MKRLGTILISLTLAMMVIALGGGVTFVRCCHINKAETAQAGVLPQTEQTGAGQCHRGECTGKAAHCCPPASRCMNVEVIKLAPYNIAQHISVCFGDFPVTPLFAFETCHHRLLPSATCLIRHTACDGFRSPPRGYLRLIRVLLI